MTDSISAQKTGHVAVVEMRRPPNNFFDEALVAELAGALLALDDDPEVRSVVLCSDGKHFCAGAQLAGMTPDGIRRVYRHAFSLFTTRRPIVAAVQGSAVGGGLGLALAADFRVATPESRFAARGRVASRRGPAASRTGQGTDYVGGGLAQGLSHAAGPQSSVSNGVVEALLLPYTMRFNAPVTGVGLTLIADALDTRSPAEPAAEERAIAAVERFLADLAVPARLRDVGITKAALAEVADHAMDDWAITRVPRRVERPELDQLLHAAW